jgi:hypothetical protein
LRLLEEAYVLRLYLLNIHDRHNAYSRMLKLSKHTALGDGAYNLQLVGRKRRPSQL